MKRYIKNALTIIIVLAVLQFSLYFPLDMNNAYGQGLEKAGKYTTPIGTTYPSGMPITGVPGLESVPATPQDIEMLKSQSEFTINASILPQLNTGKTFYAVDFTKPPTSYMEITADLKRIGVHSYIYLDRNALNVTATMLDNIVNEFESIYAKNTDSFGNAPDVDRDKRINILLMDINDSSGGSYIAGYFNSVNELPAVNYAGRSNQSEIFYMDINQGLPDSAEKMDSFFGTLAHEFQHMIQYGVYLNNFSATNFPEETWLNEAMSQLAIFLNGYGHPYADIEYYLGDTEPSNSGLLEFNNDFAEYGASYLFALYLYEKFGAAFIKNLAQNPLNGVESINEQLIKDSKNTTFEEIFEKLQIAVAIDNSTDLGDYSFSNIDLSSVRQNPSYLSLNTIMFYSLSAMSTQYTTQITSIPSTFGGAYRSYGALIDGTRTIGAINLKLGNSAGDYYIAKPADSSPVTTYSAFALAPKTIEKINPDTVNGNTITLNINQMALLIYIAKGTPIANTLTATQVVVPVDDIAPTTPAGITYTTGYNAISLSWKPSSYSKGIKGYNIYKNSVKKNVTPILTTSYTDFGLTPSTAYTYELEAVGLDDIVSSRVSVAASTTAIPDIVAPDAPSLSFVSTSTQSTTAGGVVLSLADSINDSSTIDHYEIIGFLNGMEDGFGEYFTTGDKPINDLFLNKVYNFYAYAVDKAGNYSTKSATVNIKIGEGSVSQPVPPTKPASIRSTDIKDHSVTFAWDASTAAEGILHYNIYRNGVFLTTSGSTSFADKDLADGTQYSYTVEAVGNNIAIGNETDNLNSELSDKLNVTTLNDVTSPSAIITYSDTDGIVKQGDTVLITATFNESMQTNPVPSISISGANTLAATPMTRINSTTYTYSHTVGSGNGAANITLGEGKDLSGLDVIPTPTSGASFTVDNTVSYPVPGPFGGISNTNSDESGTEGSSTVLVKPTVNDNDQATGEVDYSDLGKAFEQAESDTEGNKKVTVNIEQVAGVNDYTVLLPTSYVSSDKTDKTIEVHSALGNIEIPSNMFQQGDVGNADKVGISIGIADKSNLSDDVLKSIGNRPVIELGVTINDKPLSWKSNDASVKVTIDYTPTEDELKDPEHIVVWYIDGSGNPVSVSNGRYDPQTKKVTFSTDHFSKYAIAYVQKTFQDISGSWAKNEIEIMASKGIIKGTGDSMFSPEAEITRADFITLLIRTLELKAKFTANFSDIKTTDHYYDAVGVAKKLGITYGTGNNRFNPKESISRQDMAALTLRAMRIAKRINTNGVITQTVKFNDAKSIASYAYTSVSLLIERKIIERESLEFKPAEYITRAEMADVIYNIYNY